MCRSTSAPSCAISRLTPDLSGPCVAIVALAADKDAQGFVAELAGRASTVLFTDLPGSSRGRAPVELASACGVAWAHERGRAGRKTSAGSAASNWLAKPTPGCLSPARFISSGRCGRRSARRPQCRMEPARRPPWPGVCPRPRAARLMAPDSSLMTKARSALSTVFGFSDFRPGQEDVLAATLAGEDVLAVMPTGSGKSLLFQLPAIVRGGLTLVVSPLIALMRDQVAQLREAGVEAASLNSSSDPDERRRVARGLDERFAPTSLCRARTAVARRHDRRLEEGEGRSSRHRRGALRLAMGPRFPP